MSADRAWKRSIGRPDVEIAILDTGIRWNNGQLRKKIALNEAELPTPQTTGGAACAQDDCNGDGAFDVDDFANDPRVSDHRRPRRGRLHPRRERPDRRLRRRRRQRRQRLRRRHRRLGLLRRRQRPLRRLELLERLQPRLGPRRRGRVADERRRRRHGRLPALPDRAAAVVGHLRDGRQQLLPGRPLRRGQQHRGRGGRGRRPVQLALRPGGVRGGLPQGRLPRDRLLGPQHGRPQHPDRLRRGDAGAGQRVRRGGARPEQRRDRRLPRRPRDPHLGADRHLVPQLRHDPVRRPRPRGHAGGHRIAGHRPGGGSGRARGVLRTPEDARGAARAERDQAAAHAHRRGRGGAEHHRHRRARPRAGRLGPALRLRAPRPRARARADRPGQDPAAGPHHRPRLVRAAQPRSPDLGSDQRAAVRQARGRLHVEAPVGAGHRAGRGRLPGRGHAERLGAASTARSARSTSTPCAPRSTRAPAAAPPPIPPRPPRARATRTRTSPPSPCACVVTDTAGNRGEDRKVLFAYRDTTLHAGWARHTGTGRRGLAAAVRPGRRQPARHRGGRLERRAERAEGRRHAARRASTAASRSGRSPTRTCTRARPPTHRSAPPREVAAHAGDRRRRRRPRARDRGLGGRARLRLERRRQRGPRLPGPDRPVEVDAPRCARARTTSSAASSPRRRSATWWAAPPSRSWCRRSTSTCTPGTARATPLPGFPSKLQGSRARRGRDHQHGRRSATSPATRARRSSCPPPSSTPIPRRRARPTGPLDLAGTIRGGRHEHPRERAGRQRAHVRARRERGGPARLADQAERRGAGRASAGRARAWTTCWPTWTPTRCSR